MNIQNVSYVKTGQKRLRLSPVKKIYGLTTQIFALVLLLCVSAKAQSDTSSNKSTLFPKGEKMVSENMTGTVWMKVLVGADSTSSNHIANVTFEPGARTNWHTHPGGQTLLVMEGVGYYQEKGKPIQKLYKGDVVNCAPNVTHWHGASPGSQFSHIGITPNHPKGRALWYQKVTDQEYNSLK